MFNPTGKLVKPTGIPTKERKAEMETHPVTVETKISKCQYHSKLHKLFYASYYYQFILVYFFNETISCFHYIFSLNS